MTVVDGYCFELNNIMLIRHRTEVVLHATVFEHSQICLPSLHYAHCTGPSVESPCIGTGKHLDAFGNCELSSYVKMWLPMRQNALLRNWQTQTVIQLYSSAENSKYPDTNELAPGNWHISFTVRLVSRLLMNWPRRSVLQHRDCNLQVFLYRGSLWGISPKIVIFLHTLTHNFIYTVNRTDFSKVDIIY